MDERVILTNKDRKTIKVWASLRTRTEEDDADDDVLERRSVVILTVHNTKRNRDFTADTAHMNAEATRSMPKRFLPVVSVRPTPDRNFIVIECEG